MKTLAPPQNIADETSGAASNKGFAISLLPIGKKSQSPNEQPEYLVLHINEFCRLVKKKDLEDFNGCIFAELVGGLQFGVFQLGSLATYYKAKVGRYDKKMNDDIQTTKNRADDAEKRSGELNLENLKLVEQMSLSEAKAIVLERDMTVIKEELTTLTTFYKS